MTNEDRAREWLSGTRFEDEALPSLTALLDAVRGEERERCAAVVDQYYATTDALPALLREPTPAPAAAWVTCLESGCDKPISAYSCMLAGESANACTEHRCRCKHNEPAPAAVAPGVEVVDHYKELMDVTREHVRDIVIEHIGPQPDTLGCHALLTLIERQFPALRAVAEAAEAFDAAWLTSAAHSPRLHRAVSALRTALAAVKGPE